MNERIETEIKTFRYKRINIKALSWSLGISILIGGIFFLNYISTIDGLEILQNPFISFMLYIVLLVCAAATFTYYNDFRLRKALYALDFIVDELKDPQAYLSFIEPFGHFNRKMVTPAYLHAKLRAMMYGSSDRDIQEFVNNFKDVLGDSINVESALFRIKSYGEKQANVDQFEANVTRKLDKAYTKARSNAMRENIDNQRKWLDVQTGIVRLNFENVLEILASFDQNTMTPLDRVRADYYTGLAHTRLGNTKQAKEAFIKVIEEGNTTRFVRDAQDEYEKVRN